jgi:hypothetical protein
MCFKCLERGALLNLLCMWSVLRIGNFFDADPYPSFYFAVYLEPDQDPTLSYPIIQSSL